MQPAVSGYVYSELPVIGNKKEREEEKTGNERDAKSNLDIVIISLREDCTRARASYSQGSKKKRYM